MYASPSLDASSIMQGTVVARHYVCLHGKQCCNPRSDGLLLVNFCFR
jgi:hypothetical protein